MGAAAGSRELVINDATGQAGQDRREGRQPRAVCDFPTGRGGGAEGAVSEDPEPHRWAATKTRSGVGRENRWPGENDERGVSGWRAK